MRAILVFASILAAAAAAATQEELHDAGLISAPVERPVNARTCYRRNVDKTLNNCIRHNIQAFLPHVKNGGKFGMPSVEPFFVPKTSFEMRTGLLDYHAVLSNMTVTGLTDAVVRDVTADLGDDTMRMDVDLLFPQVAFRGMIDITGGQILTLPFKGHGLGEYTFSDVVATWRVQGKKLPEEKYMHVDSVVPTYTVGGMRGYVRLPDAALPDIDRVVNAVMNQYWPLMVDLGKPYVQKSLEYHIRSVIGAIFENVPYDQMFHV